jgi:hypothetical protein
MIAVISCLQLTIAQPKILLDLGINFAKPLDNFKGYRPAIGYTTFDESYGVFFGLGFNANFKYAMGKQRNSRLTTGLSTERFLNSSFSKDPNASSDNTDVRIHSLSIGYEYSALPKKVVNPYFGAGLSFNMMNAGYYWNGVSVDGKTEFRMGILADAGMDIRVNKNGGLIVGTKLHYANLVGKTSDPTTLNRTNEIPLNDASYIYNRKTYDAINFIFLRFYLGYRFTLSK